MKRSLRGIANAIVFSLLVAVIQPVLSQSQSQPIDLTTGNSSGFDLGTLAAAAQGATGSGGTVGSTGAQGSQNHSTQQGVARPLATRLEDAYLSKPNLPVTSFATLSNHGGNLPATRLESFVRNAGGAAEQIYGDEGTEGPPPYWGFSSGHRINAGIHSNLTTGHASNLPEAWGYPQ